jgi:hypothetical protein
MMINLDEVEASWRGVLGDDAPKLKGTTLRDAIRPFRLGRTRALTPAQKRRRFHVVDLEALNEWMDVDEADKETFAEKVRIILERGVQEVQLEVMDGDD